MKLVIHQLKKEFLANRIGLLIYGLVLLVYLMLVATGFANEFHRIQTRPLIAILFEFVTIGLSVIPVVLAAAIGIADPPNDESAHWRALPMRRQHLLVAKLLALLIGILLPLAIARTFALAMMGLQSWSSHMILDLLSSTPAWLILGLAIGAIAGNWRKCSLIIVCILGMTPLLVVSLEGLRNYLPHSFFHPMETSLENFVSTNVFLLGATTILLLRFLTQLSDRRLLAIFAITAMNTGYFFPILTQTLVPEDRIERLEREAQVTAQISPPDQLLSLTNSSPKRIAHVAYTNLVLTGIQPPDYAMPIEVNSTLQVQTGNTRTTIQTSHARLPGSDFPYFHGYQPPELLERQLGLAQAIPTHTVINPAPPNTTEFNLYEISEATMVRYGFQRIDLSADLVVQLGSYQKIAKLPLKESSTVDLRSGRLYLARVQPQVAGRTQILINEMYVRFLQENELRYLRKSVFPISRDPQKLRYLLVNPDRQEVCHPVKHLSYRVQRLHPLTLRSSIVDYSIDNGPDKALALTDEWLAGAHIEVYRKVPRGKTTLTIEAQDLKIDTLPVAPYPQDKPLPIW